MGPIMFLIYINDMPNVITKHVEETVHKANKVLGLLKRTVGSKNKEIFSILYKTFLRPILEYPRLVWSPHLAKDIHEIEKVQRRTSRIALGQRRQEMNGLNFSDILNCAGALRRDPTINIRYKPNLQN